MFSIKVFWGIQLVLAMVLAYFVYQFVWTQDIKLVAEQKLIHLLKANENLRVTSYIICPLSFLITFLYTWKNKTTKLLIIPYLLFILVNTLFYWNQEEIYRFKKHNNIFDPSFSLSMFFAMIHAVGLVFIYLINLFILRRFWLKKV